MPGIYVRVSRLRELWHQKRRKMGQIPLSRLECAAIWEGAGRLLDVWVRGERAGGAGDCRRGVRGGGNTPAAAAAQRAYWQDRRYANLCPRDHLAPDSRARQKGGRVDSGVARPHPPAPRPSPALPQRWRRGKTQQQPRRFPTPKLLTRLNPAPLPFGTGRVPYACGRRTTGRACPPSPPSPRRPAVHGRQRSATPPRGLCRVA